MKDLRKVMRKYVGKNFTEAYLSESTRVNDLFFLTIVFQYWNQTLNEKMINWLETNGFTFHTWHMSGTLNGQINIEFEAIKNE